MTKTYVEIKINDTIKGLDRSTLMVHKILNYYKSYYYEMSKYMVK